MNRFVVSILAVAAIGAAAPAFAQGPRAADWLPLAQRQDDVARRIDSGVASGALTNLQAADLRDQFKGLMNLEDDYRKTGLTLHQREDLQARYDTLFMRLNAAAQPGRVYYPAAAAEQ